MTTPPRGVLTWKANNYTVGLFHFTSDPDGKTEAERRAGISLEDYEREHNLSFVSVAGKPVFREFTKALHLDDTIFYSPEVPIWRGWDFGYHRPAVSYSQIHADGGWWVLREIMGYDISLAHFIDAEVLPRQEEWFPGAHYVDCADLAGKQVSDKSEFSSFRILNSKGIFPLARKTSIKEGLTLIRTKLHESVEGKPGLKIHPEHCPIITTGFSGGYHFPEAKEGKSELELPEKDGYYDHLMDTLRYVAINNFTLWARPEMKTEEKTRVDKVLERKGFNKADDEWDL